MHWIESGRVVIWPSQNGCVIGITETLRRLIAESVVKRICPEARARLITGAALDAALWVAASNRPNEVLPKAQEAVSLLTSGYLVDRP